MTHIIIITGARDLTRPEAVQAIEILGVQLKGAALLLHGDARGVDRLGAQVALLHRVEVIAVPVKSGEWPTARNTRMLERGLEEARSRGLRVRVIALPTQDSRGTWDTYNKAVRLREEHPELFAAPAALHPLGLSARRAG